MKTKTSDGFGGDVSNRFPSSIETLPQVRSPLPPAPQDDAADHDADDAHGFACQKPGCGKTCKSSHGFARHLRTHGFGVTGRHLGK